MQIDQIILFKHVVEQETISQAAKLCHISQPAASKQLQGLEEELGVKLIERTNRGIKMTEAGHIFYDFTISVTDMYSNLTNEMSDWKYNRESLDITACPVIANYVLPNHICELKKEYPKFAFNILPTSPESTIEKILLRQAKLGFCVDVEPHPELHLQKMFDDEIVLVSCTKYPIEDKIKISDLNKHLIVILDKKHIYYEKVYDYCKSIGIDLDTKHNVQQFYTLESIKNLLMNCAAISLMPRRSVAKEIKNGLLKEVEVVGIHIPYGVYALTNVKDHMSPLMIKIIELVKNDA
ncbi:MAG: LysR family transcriptional regulator [Erysipelothrix sp.]|nr:LysR family transcriptional regulator [Erysipelothrix sp.]